MLMGCMTLSTLCLNLHFYKVSVGVYFVTGSKGVGFFPVVLQNASIFIHGNCIFAAAY